MRTMKIVTMTTVMIVTMTTIKIVTTVCVCGKNPAPLIKKQHRHPSTPCLIFHTSTLECSGCVPFPKSCTTSWFPSPNTLPARAHNIKLGVRGCGRSQWETGAGFLPTPVSPATGPNPLFLLDVPSEISTLDVQASLRARSEISPKVAARSERGRPQQREH